MHILPSTVLFSAALLVFACSSPTEGETDAGGVGGGAEDNAGGSPAAGGAAGVGGGASGEVGAGGAGTGGAATGGMPAGGTVGAGGLSEGVGGASGGAENTGGSASGGDGSGGSPPDGLTKGACTIGAGVQAGDGQTTLQYLDADVTRDGKNYTMITNGWGQGWQSHDISWLGTSMNVHGFEGSRQSNGAPAGYPTVFCGRYSDKVSQECGLPIARSALTALNTAASWSHDARDGTYNVAYDVWLGDPANATTFTPGLESYFMVWLHDPIGEGPAGSLRTENVVIADLPGEWDIIDGTVNGLPIVNYVRAEGEETNELAFDIMDFVRDAESRNLTLPGNEVLSVAIGFEIWQGSVTELKLNDFCVDVQ